MPACRQTGNSLPCYKLKPICSMLIIPPCAATAGRVGTLFVALRIDLPFEIRRSLSFGDFTGLTP